VIEVDGKVLPYDYLLLFCGQQFCRTLMAPVLDPPCKHYPTGKGWPAAIGFVADRLLYLSTYLNINKN
jgi:hypothetical protein